jgi:hypothetical protein
MALKSKTETLPLKRVSQRHFLKTGSSELIDDRESSREWGLGSLPNVCTN